MSGGVIIAIGVVGALALFETVLPRAFAALRKWRSRAKERAEAEEEERGVPSAGNDAAVQCPLSPVREEPEEEHRTEDGGQRQGSFDLGQPKELTEASRLWDEARGLPHRFNPDWEKDQDYLSKVYGAARLGHLEAMAKLGEYAARRGAVVEAFYWTLLAELKGATGLKVKLRELRSKWQALGCPSQYGNAYEEFTEEQGSFARAVLRLQCGINPQYARARLKELAAHGVEEARLFLKPVERQGAAAGRFCRLLLLLSLALSLRGYAEGDAVRSFAAQVTLESLLEELADPDANTFVDPIPWKGRLWSSHDRRSVTPDDPKGWMANEDWSQYRRDETNAGGRVEHVMVDAKGPGALVRLWTANGRDACLRFYFDGASEPLFQGVGTNLIGGHVICPAPLADALSPRAPLEHQAQNLYLPLAYAKSLKVTVETPNKDKRFWYNAEVREYDAGAQIETVSGEVLRRARNRIEDLCAKLISESGYASSGRRFTGASLELKGPATIRALVLEAKGADARRVRVKMSFDGRETVDVSLAQLRGLRGTALSMPFRRTCRIETSTEVSGQVTTAPYRWDEKRSLYFHAKGLDLPKLPTRKGEVGHYDLNWADLKGRGRLVAHALVVGNDYLPPEKKGTWWGEGDEKIWVDDEGFPSYFGTGTEDFFGYAWGEATPYDHPLLKMPESDRNVFRLRRLDSVPFRHALKLDVEIWHNHTEPTFLDYAPATFWYAD